MEMITKQFREERMKLPKYNEIERFCYSYFKDFGECFFDPGKLSEMHRYWEPGLQAEIHLIAGGGGAKNVMVGREEYEQYIMNIREEFLIEAEPQDLTIDERQITVGALLAISKIDVRTGLTFRSPGYGVFELSYCGKSGLKIKRICLYEL